jgi:predicted transcriptional regulator
MKEVPDDIHWHANVPPELNPDLYATTKAHIESLLDEMDKRGMSANEQRIRLGRKKDELITALKELAEKGIARTGEEGQPKAKPQVIKDFVRVRR